MPIIGKAPNASQGGVVIDQMSVVGPRGATLHQIARHAPAMCATS
jgi:hypothetical protein